MQVTEVILDKTRPWFNPFARLGWFERRRIANAARLYGEVYALVSTELLRLVQ